MGNVCKYSNIFVINYPNASLNVDGLLLCEFILFYCSKHDLEIAIYLVIAGALPEIFTSILTCKRYLEFKGMTLISPQQYQSVI